MKSVLLSLATLGVLFSGPAAATPTWTSFGTVGDVYTYTTPDVLAVYLEGSQCVNVKNYYTIHPNHAANAEQLITMVLTAKAAGKQVRFFEDNTIDTTSCYIVGVWIGD